MEEFSYSLRSSVIVSSLEKCINGKTGFLCDAFTWNLTSQGFEHWRDIQMQEKPLDDESRSYLIRLRDAVLAREKGE